LKGLGIGVSTSVGIGDDPINGPSFKDILKHFEVNDETHAIVVIGEIGGPLEAEVASYISTNIDKPVVAYVAGLTAPKGHTMGHAGTINSAFGESAPEKVEIFTAVGVKVAKNPTVIGETVVRFM
jgi:succinyl-CoA synthetase alpha subunit